MIWKDTATEKRPLIPEDTYAGVCVGVVDLGTHANSFGGSNRKVHLSWEIPSLAEENEEGEMTSRFIGRKLTCSLHERSNLRALLIGWRGRDFTPEELEAFDSANVLGAPALLQVIHRTFHSGEGKYHFVNSVTKYLKEMPAIQSTSRRLDFSFDDFDEDSFNLLPEHLQNLIRESAEWAALEAEGKAPVIVPDSEIPF